MSNCTTIQPGNANLYSLRILARVFTGVGLGTLAYDLALVVIAFECAIIEF